MGLTDYPFLKELGLKEHNDGVYYGKWAANGKVVESIDPSTGNVIASVREVCFSPKRASDSQGNSADFAAALAATKDAFKVWSEVSSHSCSFRLFRSLRRSVAKS